MKQIKIKKFIDCVLPIETCNLKCHYCCITIDRKSDKKIPDFSSQANLIGKALSIEKLGGPCLINICGFGETMLSKDLITFVENLLKAGHYVMIVTNGTVTKRFKEIALLNPKLLKNLFFKFSFHYLELKRTKQMKSFFDNINLIKNLGCSYSVELTPNDEIISEIDNIKDICMNNIGAVCHLTVTRDGKKDGLPLLTKLSSKEYKKIWKTFKSPMFDYKFSIFGKKIKKYCYAGLWTLFLNLGTGELKQCYQGNYISQNIYKEIEIPFKFYPIAKNCPEPHCYNAHAFLTFGAVPQMHAPTYLKMRDRKTKDGQVWINDNFKMIFSQKLKENNKEISFLQKIFHRGHNQ